MASLFTRIINGEIPCHKIAEDDNYFAFLDIFPLVQGHTLVIPKVEEDYIFDLDDSTLAGLMVFAKKVGKAVEKACPCTRIGIVVAGLEVPHTHIHLLPMNNMQDMNFVREKLSMSQEELAEIAKRIRKEL